VGAGTGLLYLLRWFWWRINAWSEISAMIGSFVVALGFFIARKMGLEISGTTSLLITVASTTVIWVSVTMMTQPEDRATLIKFYQLVRPTGPGWKPIVAEAGVVGSPDGLPQSLLGWALGCSFVYSALFGVGSFLYGHMPQFFAALVIFVGSGYGVFKVLQGFWTEGQEPN
jgi:hypothetical protein